MRPHGRGDGQGSRGSDSRTFRRALDRAGHAGSAGRERRRYGVWIRRHRRRNGIVWHRTIYLSANRRDRHLVANRQRIISANRASLSRDVARFPGLCSRSSPCASSVGHGCGRIGSSAFRIGAGISFYLCGGHRNDHLALYAGLYPIVRSRKRSASWKLSADPHRCLGRNDLRNPDSFLHSNFDRRDATCARRTCWLSSGSCARAETAGRTLCWKFVCNWTVRRFDVGRRGVAARDCLFD